MFPPGRGKLAMKPMPIGSVLPHGSTQIASLLTIDGFHGFSMGPLP
jgi:hypothetical protein